MQEKRFSAHPWFIKRNNVAILSLILFLFFFGLTFFLGYNHYRHTKEKYLKEDRESAFLIALILDAHFQKITKAMESYANRPLLIQAVKDRNQEKAKIHLISFSKSLSEIDILVIADKHGTAWTAYPERPEIYGKNFAYRDWYKGISRNWKPYISDIDMRVVAEKDTATWIVVPFFDERGMPVGILVNTQRTVAISEIIKKIPLDSGLSISVCDRKGQLVYSSRYPFDKALTVYPFYAAVSRVKSNRDESVEVEDATIPGVKRYISSASIGDMGWNVFVGRDERAILLSDMPHYIQIGSITFLLFLMSVFSLFYFRKRLMLQQAMDKFLTDEAIRESEARYRGLFDNMSSGVAVYEAVEEGSDFVFKDFNRSAERIENIRKEELLGRRVTEVFPGVKDFGLLEVFRNVWKTGEPSFLPITFYKDNRIEGWRENRVLKLPTGEVVAVYDDVTARKQAEAEILLLNKELEQRVRDRTAQLEAANKELEAFAYSVSHDLRAPLRSIDGFSQILLEENHDRLDEKGKDCLRRIRAGSQRMGELIDDLLKLSRVSRLEIRHEDVNLSNLAHTIADELKKAHPERNVEFAIADGIVGNGDSQLLKIALENLFDNAFKFTRDNKNAFIEFGIDTKADEPFYYIRDNGVGFDMEFSNKLFGVFQRLHARSAFEGTGIGLATVQRIIHKHGGRIWAEAEVGKGATFYFTL